MKRASLALIIGAGLLGTLWILTAPATLEANRVNAVSPDLERGRLVFHASGCASCHAAPGADGTEKLSLAGGKAFATPFGTFYAPNISSDVDQGIGTWSAQDMAEALLLGTSPAGRHYYPAFPYTSYARMTLQDAVSLHAFLQTLPADSKPNRPHDVAFPFNIRRTLGGWKLLFADKGWVIRDDLTPIQGRGRYLVEGLGHCGECHTPRNSLGGLRYAEWLSGAPNPNGKGKIPAITPSELSWSEADIAEYLKSGFTPDYDSAGGEMAEVIENTSQLTDEDRAAIASYLKVLPSKK